jgi:Protein of unknown function
MSKQELDFDPPMSSEAIAIASAIPPHVVKKIDAALLGAASEKWRKVARLVGTVMMNEEWLPEGVPDLYYAQRVRQLVAAGSLEADGDLRIMAGSEVRLPQEIRESNRNNRG